MTLYDPGACGNPFKDPIVTFLGGNVPSYPVVGCSAIGIIFLKTHHSAVIGIQTPSQDAQHILDHLAEVSSHGHFLQTPVDDPRILNVLLQVKKHLKTLSGQLQHRHYIMQKLDIVFCELPF